MTDEPRISAEDMIEHLSPVLSPRARIRAVTALLTGTTGAAFTTTLWWSEPGPLPGHTHLAFALFTTFCLAWTCYGTLLLTRRIPLFATDRLIAAWLALTASTTTTALLTTVAAHRATAIWPILSVGTLFIAVTAVLTVRAHLRRAALRRRLHELTSEREEGSR
ncbi:hypothetical protein DP939_41555 [Spongiactinospora rosea]|uniref:Uncharacterized protein n=1 Tax=Spongiactinospora rosea TaxID=2248750 RepID=A0A366LLD1_9ACTN|nr:hypothetical protein [Spongiactinospora rosea]RBQ14303.1 hypothetical protein DP939_41555 [Spongiactinospora rosea]